MTNYDLLVFIGRFQPFHIGHRRVIESALEKSRHVLILIGSSHQARTIKNPFTSEERINMIQSSLDPQHLSRITIRSLRDHSYNENDWITEVQRNVDILTENFQYITDKIGEELPKNPKIGIIGYEKDNSSYYLRAFPQWKFEDVGANYNGTIDASVIRQLWLTKNNPSYFSGVVHDYVLQFITKTFPRKEFERLAREFKHIEDYKKQWANVPYPVIFHTVDAVIVQSGHVLLVKRKSAPGEGLWALPGGFVNVNEKIKDAMIRELHEETKIKVSEAFIESHIKAQKQYDAPGRSLRGRTITDAFLVEFPPGPLPKIKGSDDAAKAQWVSLSDVERMEDQFFEDHFYIIQNLLGKV